MTTAAEACGKALETLGARRIAVLSPYRPAMGGQIVRYFEEAGFPVVRSVDLACPSATAIAAVAPDELRGALLEIDGPDVDAVLQVGTNLSMVRLAAEAEGWPRQAGGRRQRRARLARLPRERLRRPHLWLRPPAERPLKRAVCKRAACAILGRASCGPGGAVRDNIVIV